MKHRLWNLIIIFLTVLNFPSIGHAQENKILGNKLDSLITLKLPAIAPGAVVMVAKNGQVIYNKAFGTSDLKTKASMQPQMLFRIGSITKQFTAIAILQLVEQGKIALTDTIQKYVKSFPSKKYPITIQNLLNQTSGIINAQAIQKPDPSKVRKIYTPSQGVDYFKDEPLRFKPGTKFEYSNSNYYLLGYIIEQVTGLSYKEYLQQYILNPAELKNTYYLDSEKSLPNMSSGYARYNGNNDKWEDAELQREDVMYAAGALISNSEDLLKWHKALYSEKLISRKTLELAFTPYQFPDKSISEYGFGWYIKPIAESKTIQHSGSADGYQTDVIYLPQEDIFIAALFNGFQEDMDWEVLSNDIARLIINKPQVKMKLTDAVLSQYTGNYIVNSDHTLVITFRNHQLFVKATNPKDRLPEVLLIPESENKFYIKESALKFEFVIDSNARNYKLITYYNGKKDAEWKKN